MTNVNKSSFRNRKIRCRTAGRSLGPITRLFSPGDFGEILKPFVFLDFFEFSSSARKGFIPHPHSGIATLTTFLEGSMSYGDTTGKRGVMTEGSVEWMCAGSGVWHAGEPVPGSLMRGYQLWLALPPEFELNVAESRYIKPEDIESEGPARLLLGRYGNKSSPIPYPLPVTYLHVRLNDGERWVYHPDVGHNIAWLATNTGRLLIGDILLERELVIFDDGNEGIEIVAEGYVEFVIGSSVRHEYPLVTGVSSVHTSSEALHAGEKKISELYAGPAFSALENCSVESRNYGGATYRNLPK